MPKYSVELSDGTKKTINWDKTREPTDQELMDAPDYVESKPSILRQAWDTVNTPTTSLGHNTGEKLSKLIDPSHGSTGVRSGLSAFAESLGDTVDTLTSPLNLGLAAATGGASLARGALAKSIPEVGAASKALFAARMAGNTAEAERLTSELNSARVAAGKAEAIAPVLSGISRGAGAGMATNAAAEGIINKDPKQIVPFVLGALGAKGHGKLEVPEEINIPESAGKFHGPNPPQIQHGPFEKTSFEGLSSNQETPKVNWQGPQQQGLGLEFNDPYVQPELRGLTSSPQQSSFDALVPDRYKAPDPIQLNQPELFQAPGEPKIIPNERPTWSNFAQQRNLPLDFDVLNDAEISEVPEIAQAAKQVVERDATSPLTSARQKKLKDMNKWRNTEENFKSNLAVLKSDSPAGASIVGLINQFRARRNTLYGHASAALKDVYDPLTPIQKSQAQSLIDMGGNSQDPMVQNAVDAFRKVSDTTADMATKSGMKIKLPNGVKIPFTGRENYWAHIYDPAMFPDREALISRLIKQDGMSPDAAKKAVENMGKTGERLIDPEYARQSNLEGYRTDLGSQLHHYDDMAHRISSAEIFGPEDISDPTSPISQLIARTRNPERVTKIISQYLGRDNHPMPHEVNFVNKLKTASTAYYLSKFALTNTSQVAMTPLVTNLNSTARAIGKFIANPKASTRAAERTGSLQTVEHMVRTQGGDKALSKLFLMKASESATRTISSIAGDLYAQDLFNKLKKNPTNARLRADIEKLTLDHADEILGQDALTEKQREYASNRVNELSQGYAESVDLPYNWSRSPYVDILTLYKKFAFTQSRLAKDAIKANPAKALPLFIGLGLIRGEATGQLKGMITGNTMEEKAKNVGTNSKLLNRVIADMAEGQFLGLAADAMLAGSKSTGLAELVSGPIIGLAGRTAYNSYQDVKNIPTISKDFTKSKLLQQVVPNRVKKAMTSKVKTGS